MIEECDGVDKIEQLQSHDNEEIYKKALNIIEKYFGVEEEGENAVTSTTNGQAYEFAGNNAVPEGGFKF